MAVSNTGYTALTGGTAGCLDTVDGTGLVNGQRAYTISDTYGSTVHRLNITVGGASNPPWLIVPVTNAGDKRWELIGYYDSLLISENFADLSDKPAARATLGLLGMAEQAANAVAITGGTASGLTQCAGTGLAFTSGTLSGITSFACNSVAITGGTLSGITSFACNSVAITGGTWNTAGTIGAGVTLTMGVGGVTADMDQGQISYVPTNYSRSILPAEVASVTDITAHLKGLDVALLSAGGGGVSPQSYVWSVFGGDGSDGDKTVSGTEIITSNMQYNNLTVGNGDVLVYGLGCDGIAVAGTLTVESGGEIRSIGVDGNIPNGGENLYIGSTIGDGADSAFNALGVDGVDGNAGASGGGGGSATSTWNGGAGGDGEDAGGAGGVVNNPGVDGVDMTTPTSWADIIGKAGGGGGSGGSISSDNSGAGGSSAKGIYIEANTVDLMSGSLINSFGGDGDDSAGPSSGSGGGGAGGWFNLRYRIGTALAATISVDGGVAGTTGNDGGDGGLGLIELEHVVSSSGVAATSELWDNFAGNGSDGEVTIDSNTEINTNKQYLNLTIETGNTLTMGLGCDGIAVLNLLTMEGSAKIVTSDSSLDGGDANASIGGAGGTNTYHTGTIGDGGDGGDANSDNAEAGENGNALLAAGGGGGGLTGHYDGGDGGDGVGSGGAGGTTGTPGVDGADMTTPGTWTDIVGEASAGGGGGGAVIAGSYPGGGGGAGVKSIYIEAYRINLPGTATLDATGGGGGGTSESSWTGGAGGGGGAILVRHIVDTASAAIMSVDGGAGDPGFSANYAGGDGGLGLVNLSKES